MIKDDFTGTTFTTPTGATLTVLGHNGLTGNKKKYFLECSVCSKDTELFPDGFSSQKSNLVQGKVPCGCTTGTIKWSEAQQKVRVKRLCESKGYKFRGWSSEFKGNTTKLKLYNPKTNNEWITTSIKDLFSGKGDPVQGKIDRANSRRKPLEQITKELTELCNKEGHVFKGFTEEYKNAHSKFEWECEHGHECSTTVNNFLNGQRCKTCADLNTGINGFYKDRVSEKDFLYVYTFKGLPFIKIGRSFEPERRLKENQLRVNQFYGNNKHTIKQIHLKEGTHQEIYDLEQSLLTDKFVEYRIDLEDGYGSSELLRKDCLEELLELLEEL